MTNATQQQAISRLNNPVITYSVFGQITTVATVTSLPTGPIKPIKVYRSGLIADMNDNPVSEYSDKRGYRHFYAGNGQTVAVHRVVLYAFTGQWSSMAEGTVVHHIDSNPANNSADNLMELSSSDNVLRFFRGADNQQYINGQRRFQTKMAESRKNPVMLVVPDNNGSWHIIADYRISADGRVWKMKNGELRELKSSLANKRYSTNRNVKIAGTTYSLAALIAFNFLTVPDGKFKTLMIDQQADNPWDATNLYTVPVKQFDK